MKNIGLLVLVVVLGVIILWLILYLIPVGLWLRARLSGVRISLVQLVFMRFRKVPLGRIVSAMINGVEYGLTFDIRELEYHYLAGGNIENVVNGLISAKKVGITFDFGRASALDHAGLDVFKSIKMVAKGENPFV